VGTAGLSRCGSLPIGSRISTPVTRTWACSSVGGVLIANRARQVDLTRTRGGPRRQGALGEDYAGTGRWQAAWGKGVGDYSDMGDVDYGTRPRSSMTLPTSRRSEHVEVLTSPCLLVRGPLPGGCCVDDAGVGDEDVYPTVRVTTAPTIFPTDPGSVSTKVPCSSSARRRSQSRRLSRRLPPLPQRGGRETQSPKPAPP